MNCTVRKLFKKVNKNNKNKKQKQKIMICKWSLGGAGEVVVLENVESLPHASSSPSIPGLMRDGVSIKWRGRHGVSCEGTELKIKIFIYHRTSVP